jgi:hypothetical protein
VITKVFHGPVLDRFKPGLFLQLLKPGFLDGSPLLDLSLLGNASSSQFT